MDIQEIYKKAKKEGSIGRALWIVGLHYMRGEDVPQDNDIAEAWFVRAWSNGFPGTASTQTFVLKHNWDVFVRRYCSKEPRLKAILEEASVSAGEQKGEIVARVWNEAQALWLESRSEEIVREFDKKCLFGRFLSVSLAVEIKKDENSE